jgi:hypothetical protein
MKMIYVLVFKFEALNLNGCFDKKELFLHEVSHLNENLANSDLTWVLMPN